MLTITDDRWAPRGRRVSGGPAPSTDRRRLTATTSCRLPSLHRLLLGLLRGPVFAVAAAVAGLPDFFPAGLAFFSALADLGAFFFPA